jgi:putative protease
MTEETPFISPKGETAWVTAVNGNYWVFPNWKLDLTENKALLEKKGYQLFVHWVERVPKRIALKKRSGLWNWDLGLA